MADGSKTYMVQLQNFKRQKPKPICLPGVSPDASGPVYHLQVKLSMYSIQKCKKVALYLVTSVTSVLPWFILCYIRDTWNEHINAHS